MSVRVCIGLGGLIDFGEGDGCVSTGERVLRVLLCVFIEWACSLVWDWSSWGPFRAAPYLSPAESIRLQIWGPPSSCVSSFPFSGGPLGHCAPLQGKADRRGRGGSGSEEVDPLLWLGAVCRQRAGTWNSSER